MNYNASQLLEVGKGLFQQGLIDEQQPQFYTHQGSQFMQGNPFVPFDNPTDTLLNQVRVNTYFDGSLSQINELGDRYREYARKINFILAYLFFNKSIYLNPSNSEVQQYIDLILGKLSLSPINILRNAYAMFKDYGLSEWMEICNSLLNNAVKSPPLEENEAILMEIDKRLKLNPNDPDALLAKGIILFQMAKKSLTLDAKKSKLSESLDHILKAVELKPSYATEHGEIMRNLLDTIKEVNNIGNLHNPLKSNNSSTYENKSKKIKCYTSEGKPVYQ